MAITHAGSCDYHCGHKLDEAIVRANPEVQQALNRDPRVVEYSTLPPRDWMQDDTENWYRIIYAPTRQVDRCYLATARELRIGPLS